MINRIAARLKMLERQRADARAAAAVVKAASDPAFAPWLAKAESAFDALADALQVLADREEWGADLLEQLAAVLEDDWGWTLANLGLNNKPEPKSKIRWFRIFPQWLGLIPADLQLPALVEMRSERTCWQESHEYGGSVKTYKRESLLAEWKRQLSFGAVSIPAGMTRETMGKIVRAVIDYRDDLESSGPYCIGCSLLYPLRSHHQPSELFPTCPHCGRVGRQTIDGQVQWGWQWSTYLK